MQSEQAHYRLTLQRHLELRSTQNPRYSLRAYARDLGLSVSQLSQILNNKLGLSLQSARQIAERLSLPQSEAECFYDSVVSLHGRRPLDRKAAKARLLRQNQNFSQAFMDHFRLVSDWYHLAILQLVELKGFQAEPRWIASHLRISQSEAEQALARLLRLELLKKSKGKLIAVNAFNTYASGQSSDTVKRFHLQILDRAKRALLFDSVEERNFSAMVMSMNSKRYPEMVERLKKFRREVAQELSQDKEKDIVVCLSQQFFELKGDESHE